MAWDHGVAPSAEDLAWRSSFITSRHRGAMRINPPCITTRAGATRAIVNPSVVSENGPAHLTVAAPSEPGTGSPSRRSSFIRPLVQGQVPSCPGDAAHGHPIRVRPSATRGWAIPRLQHMRDLLHGRRPRRARRARHPAHPQPPADASASVVTQVRPRPPATRGRSARGAGPGLSGVQLRVSIGRMAGQHGSARLSEAQPGSARLRQARRGD
jgi:hypothetical protein